MNIKVDAGALSGETRAIPSKSMAHRLLLASALSDAETRISPIPDSDDIKATLGCLEALGAKYEVSNESVTITPVTRSSDVAYLNCMESGSTLRFMLPIAATLRDRTIFSGEGRLPRRPIGELVRCMKLYGVDFSSETLPFETRGRLRNGHFSLPGNISSQYITGLLFALPKLSGDSEIRLTTPLESSMYVEMTLSVLSEFGIAIERDGCVFNIPGGQSFVSPDTAKVEGDWSNAAVMLAFGAIGHPVRVTGLDPDSQQCDKRIVELLQAFGANVNVTDSGVTVEPAELHGIVADLRQSPDLLPTLAVVAANARGQSVFTGLSRLRLKESDRIASCVSMLKSLGGRAEIYKDSLTVFGGELAGGRVSGFSDHRLVMAAALASAKTRRPVEIEGAEAVRKSQPDFFDEIDRLGGNINVL